jgi:hypothetical protein
MLRRTILRRGGGDKSVFADKRRVLTPMNNTPVSPGRYIKAAYTTDALKESDNFQFATGGQLMNEVLDVPRRLEGEKSRAAIEELRDEEFDALVAFVTGARFDQMITGRRFRAVYDKLSNNDDVFLWLCMTSMAVLNPGDMRSRLMYRHLEALLQAVALGEMTMRTAFKFFEAAVRSPAFREIARRQLETGASSRVAGLCAAADAMKRLGLSRRPMSAYFELYQRISERSESMTPWGFPPLFQFEERLALEDRLKFFTRANRDALNQRQRTNIYARQGRYMNHRIFWIPYTWMSSRKWHGPSRSTVPGLIAD